MAILRVKWVQILLAKGHWRKMCLASSGTVLQKAQLKVGQMFLMVRTSPVRSLSLTANQDVNLTFRGTLSFQISIAKISFGFSWKKNWYRDLTEKLPEGCRAQEILSTSSEHAKFPMTCSNCRSSTNLELDNPQTKGMLQLSFLQKSLTKPSLLAAISYSEGDVSARIVSPHQRSVQNLAVRPLPKMNLT